MNRFPGVIDQLVQEGKEARLVETAVELGDLRDRRDVFEKKRQAGEEPSLPSPLNEVSEAAYALEKKLMPVLSSEAQSLIVRISPSSEEVRVFRTKLDSYMPVGSAEDARWLLTHSDDETAAELAIDFAHGKYGLMVDSDHYVAMFENSELSSLASDDLQSARVKLR